LEFIYDVWKFRKTYDFEKMKGKVDKSASDKPADKPSDEVSEEPSDKPSEKSDESSDKGADESSEKPSDKPSDESSEKSSEKSSDKAQTKAAAKAASKLEKAAMAALRKEMVDEARRIFAKYLEPGNMYCDPRLVEEVRNAVKGSGKGVTCTTFRKCAAFITYRSECSWGRQARATILWANKSYDNHSEDAEAAREEFSVSILPEDISLQIVPTVDDMLACPELLRDYSEFVGKETYEAFMRFRNSYEEYFKVPPASRKPLLQNVNRAYGEVAALFPKLKPVHQLFSSQISRRGCIADSVFSYLSYTIIHATSKKYYQKWLIDHAKVWKTVAWSPVPVITYSDMTSIYGMSSVQQKIEEAALKGKTGLSRLLAKRAMKKQLANVHVSTMTQGSDLSPVVYATTDARDMLSFASPRSPLQVDSSDPMAFPVPTIIETLSSSYLRNHFENCMLKGALKEKEYGLWQACSQFFLKYSTMDDERMDGAQSEMRKEIEEICRKYRKYLRNPLKIIERSKKQRTIFPQFFRVYEVEVFGKYHEDYQKLLKERKLNN